MVLKCRPYLDIDCGYIERALLLEGLTKEEMTYLTDDTIVTDIGFFSYQTEILPGCLFLKHFCVDRDKRSFKNYLKLLETFKNLAITLGYCYSIVQKPRNKPFLGKFIERQCGKEIYQEKGHTYYMVPIFKDKKKKEKANENL